MIRSETMLDINMQSISLSLFYTSIFKTFIWLLEVLVVA